VFLLVYLPLLITNTLRVIGDSSDKVEATGFNKSTASDVANGITLGNVTYDVYINTSASTAHTTLVLKIITSIHKQELKIKQKTLCLCHFGR
jgi:hypothetical protein